MRFADNIVLDSKISMLPSCESKKAELYTIFPWHKVWIILLAYLLANHKKTLFTNADKSCLFSVV